MVSESKTLVTVLVVINKGINEDSEGNLEGQILCLVKRGKQDEGAWDLLLHDKKEKNVVDNFKFRDAETGNGRHMLYIYRS